MTDTSPLRDASGVEVGLAAPPRRLVSLVPSVTELLFQLGLGEAVVGCTTYCTEPPEGVAAIARVGGTKTPRLEDIRHLQPDLVIANVEENHREHVEALRAAGITVYVCYPRTVGEAIALIRDLGSLAGAPAAGAQMAGLLEARLAAARRAREGVPAVRVFCPIWRRPYMTINRDTYVHDVLAECGGVNVFADRPARYPEVTLAEVSRAAPEVILLPDEPYRFRRAHVAELEALNEAPAARSRRIHLLDGKLLTWFGPRIAEALEVVPPLLTRA